MAPTILAIDTSGAHCSLALLRDGSLVADAHAGMARGQAEALMPMADKLLSDTGIDQSELDGIGVGVGPGNFTGLRIAVAAARGLALGLGKPAIGISGFAVLLAEAGSPEKAVLVSLPAPRGSVYCQEFSDGQAEGQPFQAVPEMIESRATLVIGAEADRIAQTIGDAKALQISAPHPAPLIASLAAAALAGGTAIARPAPLYIRKPDAAPSAQPAPDMLP